MSASDPVTLTLSGDNLLIPLTDTTYQFCDSARPTVYLGVILDKDNSVDEFSELNNVFVKQVYLDCSGKSIELQNFCVIQIYFTC